MDGEAYRVVFLSFYGWILGLVGFAKSVFDAPAANDMRIPRRCA